MGYFFNASTIHRQANEGKIKEYGKQLEQVSENIAKSLGRIDCKINKFCATAKNLGEEFSGEMAELRKSRKSCQEILEKTLIDKKTYQAIPKQFQKPRFLRIRRVSSDVLVQVCINRLANAKKYEVDAGNLELKVKRQIKQFFKQADTKEISTVKILARLP